MSEILRREVPMALSTAIIAVLLFDYYVKLGVTATVASILTDWAVVITVTAAGVGVITMVLRTRNTVKRREPYWYLDIWMIVCMMILIVPGFMGVYGTHPAFQWIMTNIYLAIDGTVYSLVMFDMVAAFYRTFRARTKESIVLMISALIVMLRNTPLSGPLMPWAVDIGDWLYNFPSTGGSRAFLIVAAIGVIGFAVRTMLWHEKGSLGVME